MSSPKSFSPLFIRSSNNYDFSSVSLENGLSCPDPSLTQQQFLHETDINTIVNIFMKTGHLPDQTSMPQYLDYEGIFDFQSAMNVVRQADENFMTMPASIRARFHNSPQEFLEFFANPDNVQEAIRLGLAVPPDKQPGSNPTHPEAAEQPEQRPS
ncbi:MAG: internal scaffolding protein [Microvirus sp.]|nr:MAG: internal scaffolding protein [Microvirus sp.]